MLTFAIIHAGLQIRLLRRNQLVVSKDVVDIHGGRLPGRARGTTMFFANKRLVQISKPGQVIVPIMGKTFHLTLDGFDLGQILDGLRCRHESWANTAIYLRDDYFPDDSFACEECSDPDEVQKIEDHYQRIINAIERQVDEQGAW